MAFSPFWFINACRGDILRMTHAIRRRQSAPHKPDEVESDDAALEASGQSFNAIQVASLPTHVVDARDPRASVSGEHMARLAHDQIGSSRPFVIVQRGLRVTAMEDLPGTSYPMLFRMLGLHGFIGRVDASAARYGDPSLPAHRGCFLEVSLVHMEREPLVGTTLTLGGYGRKTFTYQLYGHIPSIDELEGWGLADRSEPDLLDVFVPLNERYPLRLLTQRRETFEQELYEQVFLAYVAWLEARSLQASYEAFQRSPTITPPAMTPVASIAPQASTSTDEGFDSHDDTEVFDRAAVYAEAERLEHEERTTQLEGPGVYRKSGTEHCAVSVDRVRKESQQTLYGYADPASTAETTMSTEDMSVDPERILDSGEVDVLLARVEILRDERLH